MGQTLPEVSFLAHTQGTTIFFAASEVTFSMGGSAAVAAHSANAGDAEPEVPPVPQVARLTFVGANQAPDIVGGKSLPGQTNYFQGNDRAQWHTHVPTYAGVTYGGLYPGVDLAYSGADGQLKGTYTVASSADPGLIRWRYEDAASVRVDSAGNLLVEYAKPGSLDAQPTNGQSSWTLTEQTPIAWQVIDGQRVAVQVRYVVDATGTISFALGSYDATQPLVIDPTLVFATYLGGIGEEAGYDIVVAPSGDIYLAGYTSSSHTFPTMNPATDVGKGYWEAFVTRMSPDGQTMLYSTYLAGTDWDVANGIAVDKEGNIYVGGETSSPDFPVVNPLQPKYGGGTYDAFLTEISDSGDIIYSTYLGGSGLDRAHSLALDNEDRVILAGYTGSPDFPVQNPLQKYGGGINDTFVAKIDTSTSKLIYSTYLGGSGVDYGSYVAAGADGSAIVTGYTASADFPMAHPVQGHYGGGAHDVFVSKLAPDGSSLIYSTFLGGGSEDVGEAVATDSAGNAYVTGYTNSYNFPTSNAIQSQAKGSGSSAFITKLNPAGSAIVYSTYLGGSAASTVGDQGLAIAVNAAGSAYVAGSTGAADFPVVKPVQPNLGGKIDAFVAKINAAGSALDYSTYLGGLGEDYPFSIALDKKGDAYITGSTYSSNFPMAKPYQDDKFGSGDLFLAEISDTPDVVLTPGVDRTPQAAPTWIYITDDDGNPAPDPLPVIGAPAWASTPWAAPTVPTVASTDSDDDNDNDNDTTPGAKSDTDDDSATLSPGANPTLSPVASPSAIPIAAGTDTQSGQTQTILWLTLAAAALVGIAALLFLLRNPVTKQPPSKPVTKQASSKPVTKQLPGRPVTKQSRARTVTRQPRSRP